MVVVVKAVGPTLKCVVSLESMFSMAVLRGIDNFPFTVEYLVLLASDIVPSSAGGVASQPLIVSVVYLVPMAHLLIDSPNYKDQLIAV